MAGHVYNADGPLTGVCYPGGIWAAPGAIRVRRRWDVNGSFTYQGKAGTVPRLAPEWFPDQPHGQSTSLRTWTGAEFKVHD